MGMAKSHIPIELLPVRKIVSRLKLDRGVLNCSLLNWDQNQLPYCFIVITMNCLLL